MRWCQAQAEDQLPPVHANLALAKKGNRRATMQAAVSNAMPIAMSHSIHQRKMEWQLMGVALASAQWIIKREEEACLRCQA
jgi:hypothetical protein